MASTTRIERPLWLPSAVREGGKRGWYAALAGGVVLGAVSLVIPVLLPDPDAFAFFGVFMGAVAGVYLGFALTDGRMTVFRVENLGLVVFGALATLAFVLDDAWFLVAGYLGHAAWDGLHPHPVGTRMPWWYVPTCIGWDTVFGVYILIRFV